MNTNQGDFVCVVLLIMLVLELYDRFTLAGG